MPKLLFYLLFTFCSLIPYAQNHIQSINNKLVEFSRGKYEEGIYFIDSIVRVREPDSLTYSLLVSKCQYLIFQNEIENIQPLADEAHQGFITIKEDSLAFNVYYKLGVKLMESGNYSEARKYITYAREFSEEKNLIRLNAHALNSLGVTTRRIKGKSVEALEYYFGAMSIYEQFNDSSNLFRSYGNIANIFSSLKNYDKALEYNYKGLEVVLRTKNFRNAINFYINIGGIHRSRGDSTELLNAYLLSNKYALQESGILPAYTLNNLGSLYLQRGNPDSAKYYLDRALQISESFGDSSVIYSVRFNLGKLGVETGNQIDGLNQMLAAKKGLMKLGLSNNRILNFLDISDVHAALDQLNNAILNAEEVYELGVKRGSSGIRLKALERLHVYYQMRGNHSKAYTLLQELYELQTRIYDEEEAAVVGGMEAERRLVKKEQENLLLLNRSAIQDIQIENQRMVIILIGVVSVSIMFVGFFFVHQQKIKKRLVELELKKTEQHKKLIENELEYKSQQLVNFAMQITQKNEFIQSLKEKIKGAENPDIEGIAEIVKVNESITKDREEFEQYVQNVCEGFFVKLNQRYPEITSSDKRLAALLRLDLSSKEISTVLNISPKSVDMGRYRLRKKMDLEASSNLVEVLQSI